MKRILAAMLIILVIPASSYGFPILYAGARQLQFGFEFRDSDAWHMQLGYGRFVTEELMLGAFLTYSDNHGTSWSMGGTMEHHFHLGTMTYPYIGGILMYEDYTSGNHVLFGPVVGFNHFLTDYFAIDLNARYLFSSDGRNQEDLEITGGLRVLF